MPVCRPPHRSLRPALVRTHATRIAFTLALLAGMVLAAAPVGAEEEIDVQALMRRVDRLWRGDSSQARMSMTVKTRHYTRQMTMAAWSEGKEKSLVRILAPKKDEGVATLKVKDNIWNYFPKINRVTKVPPSMMMGSWMGSHFTNDDLVKESSYEEDYTSTITFNGRREGKAIYEVTSLPRPQAAVVWGKVTMEIEQAELLPVRAVYYDEEGKRVRTMTFEAPRRFGDRTLPSRLVLRPEDKPEESTTIVYDEIALDVPLPPDLFSLQELRAAR